MISKFNMTSEIKKTTKRKIPSKKKNKLGLSWAKLKFSLIRVDNEV